MKKRMALKMALAGAALCEVAWGYDLTPVNLVTEFGYKENGSLVVSGTPDAWSDATHKEAVFDGDTSTFFDAKPATGDTYTSAGFRTTVPTIPMKIRYRGRTGKDTNAKRAANCRFEAATQADFSDAVTLHVTQPPSGWDGSTFVEVQLNDWLNDWKTAYGAEHKFSYYRVVGTTKGDYSGGACCGNFSEIEIYGLADYPAETAAPNRLTDLTVLDMNGFMNIRVNALPGDAYALRFDRRPAGTEDWTTVGGFSLVYLSAGTGKSWHDSHSLAGDDYDYRVVAINGAGETSSDVLTARARSFATGTVLGTSGSWNNSGMTRDKLFDGDSTTYFDAAVSDGVWAGLDLGTEKKIKAIRYVPRGYDKTSLDRMANGKFQIAQDASFQNGLQTLATIARPSALTVYTIALDSSVTTRYIRYLSPNGGGGNAAEIEFELDVDGPTDFAISRTDLTNQYARLSWKILPGADYSAVRVLRATSAEGPFETIAEIAPGVTSFTDETADIGRLYHYRLGFVRDGQLREAGLTDVITHRRCRRLERSWDDLTKLADGVTVRSAGTPWTATSGVETWFDGNVKTFGDMTASPQSSVRGGLRFPTAVSVGFIRLLPRNQGANEYLARLNGDVVYGTNDDANWTAVGTLLATLSGVTAANVSSWFELPVSDATPFTNIVVYQPANNFYCSFAEFEVYGWTAGDLDGDVLPPAELTLTVQDGPVVRLSWKPGMNAQSYRVERQVNGGEWSVVAEGVTDVSYDDRDLGLTPSLYAYRVVSVRGQREAVGETALKAVYSAGNGTGLQAVYRAPYRLYGDSQEAVVRECVENIDFNWGTGTLVPDTSWTDYVGVVWNGRLIVPLEGDYVFAAQHDDGVLLTVDGQVLIDEGDWSDEIKRSAPVHLTAGEHPIRLDYCEWTGGAAVRLMWRGPDGEETVIPAAQLIPEPVSYPGAWEGERTYGQTRFGWTRFADEQTFTIAGHGTDIWQAKSDGHFVWQRVKGDFKCTMRYEVPSNYPKDGKVMILTRNTLAVDSPLLAATVVPANKDCYGNLKYRTSKTDGVADLLSTWKLVSKPITKGWIKLERRNGVFTGSFRADGDADWTEIASYVDKDGAFAREQLIGVQLLTPGAGTMEVSVSNFEVQRRTGLIISVR